MHRTIFFSICISVLIPLKAIAITPSENTHTSEETIQKESLNAIDILLQDHQKIKTMISELEKNLNSNVSQSRTNFQNLKTFIDQLSFDIEDKMEKGLAEYEVSHSVDVNYTPFAFVLFDEQHEAIGVLDAFSSYSCIHIRDLWIDKAHRGKGYGRKLIEALENHFKGKGLNNINTVSCAFQAPDFYKKCGYKVEFVRENVSNPKLTMTFLIKYFDEI